MILVTAAMSVSAQEGETETEEAEVFIPTYTLGDQMLSINLGLFIPLFFHPFDGAVMSTGLTIGGVGSLQWQAFLNNNLSLGLELCGMFSFSRNLDVLFMLPITARISYTFRSFPFEFPIYLGAGVNFSRHEDMFKIDPILKPGVSVFWNATSEWAFGLNVVYWWIPQIYLGDLPRASQGGFGNFMEITLSALYHF